MQKRILAATAGLFLLTIRLAPAALARQGTGGSNNSDLLLQNMSRVGASPAEIKSVLLKESGLMVELKRWLAKDATDHGQIVIDSDLTNDAIFDRLETDVQFRSVATTLLQRYGYLLPNMNPSSEEAKESALLMQERTKLRAQSQEGEPAQARQQRAQDAGTQSQQPQQTVPPP